MPRVAIAALLVLAFHTTAHAQPERFELGQRLRDFERAWEKQTDAEARKRAVEPLIKATTAFFSLRVGVAAQNLDQARFALASEKEASAAVQWACSLYPNPAVLPRFMDAAKPTLTIQMKPLYVVAAAAPEKAELLVQLIDGKDGKPIAQTSVPFTTECVSLACKGAPPGDHRLRIEIRAQDAALAGFEQTISLAADLKPRLATLKKSFHDSIFQSTEAQTFAELRKLVVALAEGKTLETNYPAARLLVEAEELTEAIRKGQPYYALPKTGEFWLRVAHQQAGKNTEIVRLFVPDKIAKDRPVPLVIALHGAGGSENMFFDGYGDGKIVRLCRERGWTLAAPRVSAFISGMKLEELVGELGRRWPIDAKRVFLVGHSMGAMQATQIALRNPGKIAGVAALGGGQRIDAAPLQDMPFFVGVGSRDFLLRNARALSESLSAAEAKHAVFREYPDIEHLVIVQQALPDVFAFFDRLAATR